MAYFNYHAKAQSLIKSKHCTNAILTDKHNSISPALVLYFDNHPPMPIRFKMWNVYHELLSNYGVEVVDTLTKFKQ